MVDDRLQTYYKRDCTSPSDDNGMDGTVPLLIPDGVLVTTLYSVKRITPDATPNNMYATIRAPCPKV
jgi:hypothetical protein